MSVPPAASGIGLSLCQPSIDGNDPDLGRCNSRGSPDVEPGDSSRTLANGIATIAP